MAGLWKYYFFIMLSTIGYSATPIFVKLSYLGGMLPLPLISLRFFLSAWLLFIYFIITGKINLKELPQKIINLGLPGFIGYGGAVIGFLMSLHYLSAPVASILYYTYPTFVTVFSIVLFKERFSHQKKFALLLTFCGILFIINIFDIKNFNLNPLGIVYGILAAICYALFNIYGQKNISSVQPMQLSFYPLAAGAILLPLFESPMYIMQTQHVTANIIFGFGLAVISTVLPMILYFKGLEKIKASSAAIMASFEPIFTAILATFILGDIISTSQIIGGIFILFGVLILQTEGY